jgi:hypothetical protein
MKEKEKLRTIGMEDIGKEQIWKSSSRGEEKHVSSPIFSWPLLLDTCLKTPTPNSLQQFLLYIYHYFYFLLYFTTPLQKNPPTQKSSPTISYRAPHVYSCIFYSLWEQGYKPRKRKKHLRTIEMRGTWKKWDNPILEVQPDSSCLPPNSSFWLAACLV